MKIISRIFKVTKDERTKSKTRPSTSATTRSRRLAKFYFCKHISIKRYTNDTAKFIIPSMVKTKIERLDFVSIV